VAWHSTETIYEHLDSRLVAQLTNDADGATVDEDVLTACLASAREYIESYLYPAGVYTPPLSDTEVGPALRSYQADVLLYILLRRRGGTISDTVMMAYQAAIDRIIEFQKGRAIIPGADESAANALAGAGPYYSARTATQLADSTKASDTKFFRKVFG
jgi:phage gp36-like protein